MERPPARPMGLTADVVEVGGESLVVLSWPLAAPPRELPEAFGVLSDAERAVVGVVLDGCSNAEVATARQTSLGTVRMQSESVYRKLGVGSRGVLAALAARGR